ncbi:MAG: Porphobilinogen deaminase [Pedosphaera sp.]|nr:Porphobilinogen deaminase [Pedosphaera sp.]
MPPAHTFFIATRGSALALAQANAVLAQCRTAFPRLKFALKIITTTGDKLQTASLAREGKSLPKGLFTKELEVALLEHHADLAVHSLKDLPTELPPGLHLGAVGKRADVRDVLIYRAAKRIPEPSQGRGLKPKLTIKGLPKGATVGTSSTRRKSQLLDCRPELNIVELRGNVLTRLQKLADQPELDAIILAAAGLQRLHFHITPAGKLRGKGLPDGLLATILAPEVMLPCVGQGALGFETRVGDARIAPICERLNHPQTWQCVSAERAFLAAMGGGCQSPVAAYAEIIAKKIRLRAVSFRDPKIVRRGEGKASVKEAVELGRELATELGASG